METERKLLLLGLSHNSAKEDMRGCFGVDPARKAMIETALAGCGGLGGFVVLCTCNRVELYASPKTKDADGVARRIFIDGLKLDPAFFERNGYRLEDCDAARHLIEVCAGLDSLMIGETEILGQAKQAYADAAAGGYADAMLHRIFQKSFSAAKHVRENSEICTGRATLGSVASELARRVYGDFESCKILLVGAGGIGADVAGALRTRGARDIVVASRTIEHAETLAREIGARAVSMTDRADMLADSDVAIYCTASPEPVLTKAEASAVMKKRRGKNLLVIDLSVPPNVESAVGDLPDVFLYTFDDLATAVNDNLKERGAAIAACKVEIGTRAEALWRDVLSRSEERNS